MSQNIGVFIDRDGTISEEVGYVNHLSRYQVYSWTAEAIRNFNEAGLKVIVVTNQAGVARGYFTEELVKQVHEKLVTEMTRSQGLERSNGRLYSSRLMRKRPFVTFTSRIGVPAGGKGSGS